MKKPADAAGTAFKFLNARRPLVIGHRGCAAHAPENTIAALKLGLRSGADLVEVDYHHSSDGTPVVIHDPSLTRTTDAIAHWGRKQLRVEQRTAAELQQLDAGSWFHESYQNTRIPLLGDALRTVTRLGGTTVIEHKSGDAATCVRLLRKLKLVNHVILISFHWDFLRSVHASLPEQILGALGPPRTLADGAPAGRRLSRLTLQLLATAKHFQSGLLVWNTSITRKELEMCHAAGLRVWIYTVDELSIARRLIAWGVDGLISNDPGRILGLLGRDPDREA